MDFRHRDLVPAEECANMLLSRKDIKGGFVDSNQNGRTARNTTASN